MKKVTVSALRNCEDVHPFLKTLTLDELVEALQPRGTSKDGPAICGAVFDPPYRKKANVKEVGALILDIDDAEGTIGTLTAPLADYEAVLWTTWSHTDPNRPKYRHLLPLKRSVTPDEYAALWQHINKLLGGIVDPATKDASRLMYLPRETGESGQPASVFPHIPPERRSKGWLDPDDLPGGASVAELVAREQERKAKRADVKYETNESELQSALDAIDPSALNYDEWLKVGMALHAEGVDVSVWDIWSQRDERYEQGVCEEKWESFEGNGTTLGTVYHLARQHGWDRPVIERTVKPDEWDELETLQKPKADEKPRHLTRIEFPSRNDSKVARYLLQHHQAETGEDVVYDLANFWQWSGIAWEEMGGESPGDALARTLDGWQAAEQMWLKPTENRPEGQVYTLSATQQAGIIKHTRIVASRPGFFDTAPRGIAFGDAFVQVEGRRITVKPQSSAHRQRHAYPWAYDPDATCHETEKYVSQILVGEDDADTEARCRLFWQFFGAAILGIAPNYMRALVLYGRKGCGKSTLGEIVAAAMPEGSQDTIQPHDFADDKKAIAFASMRLNYVAELQHERPVVNHTLVKSVIGGETITARDVYRSKATFRPQAAQLWCANRLPGLPGVDGSFWDRFMMMECKHQFRGTSQEERGLHRRLVEQELQGIVARAIRGAEELLRNERYSIPPSSERALQDNWVGAADAVSLFLAEACEMCEDAPVYQWSKPKDIHTAYLTWAGVRRHNSMSHHELMERLQSRGVQRKKSGVYRLSVRLVPARDWDDETDQPEEDFTPF